MANVHWAPPSSPVPIRKSWETKKWVPHRAMTSSSKLQRAMDGLHGRSMDALKGLSKAEEVRSFYGLRPVLPPSFRVTSAHALHELVIRESNTVKKCWTKWDRKKHKIPEPPELLSKFSLALSQRPMRREYYLGGPPFAMKTSLVTLQQPPLKSESSNIPKKSSFLLQRDSKRNQVPDFKELPKFQLRGLKTQGVRSKILGQLEKYRLNSEARMQLKHRAEAYVLERHEKYRSKQASRDRNCLFLNWRGFLWNPLNYDCFWAFSGCFCMELSIGLANRTAHVHVLNCIKVVALVSDMKLIREGPAFVRSSFPEAEVLLMFSSFRQKEGLCQALYEFWDMQSLMQDNISQMVESLNH